MVARRGYRVEGWVRVMERFISTIDSPGLASRLLDEISGPRGFRRSRQNSPAMTTSAPAGIGSVTMPASATPERGSPIAAIDPPTDPSEDHRRANSRISTVRLGFTDSAPVHHQR